MRGRPLSSQYLKTIDMMLVCVSFSPKILLKSTGPNSVTVALSFTPFSAERDISSTGKACGWYGSLVFSYLSWIRLFISPVAAIPERSPLISITKEATPWWESCSTKACSVLVLPVPVAPAMRPCLLIVRRGMFTSTSGMTSPSKIPFPRVKKCPFAV